MSLNSEGADEAIKRKLVESYIFMGYFISRGAIISQYLMGISNEFLGIKEIVFKNFVELWLNLLCLLEFFVHKDFNWMLLEMGWV